MQTIGDFNRGTNQYNATAANTSAQANLDANLKKNQFLDQKIGFLNKNRFLCTKINFFV